MLITTSTVKTTALTSYHLTESNARFHFSLFQELQGLLLKLQLGEVILGGPETNLSLQPNPLVLTMVLVVLVAVLVAVVVPAADSLAVVAVAVELAVMKELAQEDEHACWRRLNCRSTCRRFREQEEPKDDK